MTDSMNIRVSVARVRLTDGSYSYDVRIDNGSGDDVILSATSKDDARALAGLIVHGINKHTTDVAVMLRADRDAPLSDDAVPAHKLTCHRCRTQWPASHRGKGCSCGAPADEVYL